MPRKKSENLVDEVVVNDTAKEELLAATDDTEELLEIAEEEPNAAEEPVAAAKDEPEEAPARAKQQQTAPLRRKFIEDDTIFFIDRNEREQEIKKEWTELQKHMRKRDIMGGQVIEATPDRNKKNVNIIVQIDDMFTAIIPDEAFFPDNAFKSDFENETESGKMQRKLDKARACIDAWVPFIIKGMQIVKDEDRSNNYVIIGSRIEALQEKQIRSFTGKNPVQEGDIVTAEVISVGEHFANIEALGVMCNLSPAEIDAFRYISDCRDALAPGDQIDVAIKRIHRNEDGSIKMNVSGAAIGNRQLNKSFEKLEKGSVLSGIVRNFNPATGVYSVIKKSKSVVSVSQDLVAGGDVLCKGDRVTVVIIHKSTNAAWGIARKK